MSQLPQLNDGIVTSVTDTTSVPYGNFDDGVAAKDSERSPADAESMGRKDGAT